MLRALKSPPRRDYNFRIGNRDFISSAVSCGDPAFGADDSLLRIDLIVRPENGRGQAALTIIRASR